MWNIDRLLKGVFAVILFCLTLNAFGEEGNSDAYDRKELHVIGVYEGPRHFGRPVDDPSGSTINVRVHVQGHPVVLALFNYDPVLWNITADSGVEIKEIVLSSYSGAKFSGVDESAVRITRQNIGIAYEFRQFEAIAPTLKRLTGLDVKSSQGGYKGTEFSVGP